MKRMIDITVSALLLTILSPVLAVIAALVTLRMGRPVIFKQDRPGLHSQIFRMYKFRTMTDDRDKIGNLLPDEQRMTSLGRFLRSTSLDELPELWNVLRGDMSLVGPRPLLVEYLDHYPPRHAQRHNVHPGITGWAQINGRNATSWEQRLDMDAWYVQNKSLSLDLTILLRTLKTAISREGINTPGYATTPDYLDELYNVRRESDGSNEPVPIDASGRK